MPDATRLDPDRSGHPLERAKPEAAVADALADEFGGEEDRLPALIAGTAGSTSSGDRDRRS